MCSLVKLCICLMISIIGVSSKSYKQMYQSNSNFDNPERWSGGEHEFPCAGDRVEFSPNQIVSVFVQTNTTITEMYLPMNGEFIFDDDVMWGGSEELSSCNDASDHDSHAITYNSNPDNWFDPNNWKAYDLGDGGEKDQKDLLDVEKVPCDFDQVFFPSQNSWTIGISLDLQLRSLNIWEKNYDSNSFAMYRSSASGRYQFQGNSAVTVEDKTCSDPTGCSCRNSAAIQDEICAQIPCSNPQCNNPVSPVGQCCGVCGSMMTMTYEAGYTESAMQQEIDILKADSKYSGVHTVLSKVLTSMNYQKHKSMFTAGSKPVLLAGDDYIQITIQDENTGTDLGKTAKMFSQELYDILAAPSNNLGVSNVETTSSGEGIASPQGGLGAGDVAGIVIGVILALVLIIILIIMFMRSGASWSSYIPHFKLKEERENIANPLYEMSKSHENVHYTENAVENVDRDYGARDSSVTGIPDSGVMTSDFGISFGNPMYEEEDV